MDLITEKTTPRKGSFEWDLDWDEVEVAPEPTPYVMEEVLTQKQLDAFLDLPKKIYDWSSPYIAPLNIHLKDMLGPIGAPEKHILVAKLGNEVVARIAFKVHRHHKTVRLHFGFFECMPEHALAARSFFLWARKTYRDMEIMGPFHFRQEDPYVGTLVQGFELEPYFLMSYNPPIYDHILKGVGLRPVMDLFTYDLIAAEGCPPLIEKNAEKAIRELGLTFRPMNPKKLMDEARLISRIFNEALAENWGFEEFDDSQINEMVALLKYLIDPRIVAFAMVDGKEVGCLLMLPNYNPLIKNSQGRLSFGLLRKYLMRKRLIKTMRGYALGIRKEYWSKGVGSALTSHMFKTGRALGIEKCEVSWILANNSPMNDLAVAMGGKQQKTYRIYSSGSMSH